MLIRWMFYCLTDDLPTGFIPTELESLARLNRVWLTENKLAGTGSFETPAVKLFDAISHRQWDRLNVVKTVNVLDQQQAATDFALHY